MIWLLPLAAAAHAQDCERVSVGDLTREPGPGVLVLGERQGTNKDLKRARKIALKLGRHGPVTLALEAVDASAEGHIERLNSGALTLDMLPAALGWETHSDFSFDAYAPLFKLAGSNIRLTAIGQPIELRPNDATVALPPGYMPVLSDTMGDGLIPVELESTLVQTMAWHDQRLARAALKAWNGQGWLVVVVDRTWVQGGLGVQWQAQRISDAAVTAALLADAGGRCYPGDRHLP